MQIKDILDFYGIKATFFEVGEEIALDGNASISQALAADGMLVENHTWDHQDLTTLTPDQIRAEFQSTSDAIFNATGRMPEYYRPPYGAHDATVDSIAAEFGMQPVTWTADTWDWNIGNDGVTVDTIVQEALSRATDGGVLLMHDGGGDRTATIEALPQIIEGLQALGYEFVTLHGIENLPVTYDTTNS
jgi:peptidoglycan/xylan/chitin deacetylase (PgdA/CDA1 family)